MSCPSWLSFGGESGCNVVVDDMESSMSEVFESAGELARNGDGAVVVLFRERIFCVIRVCENGLAGVCNGIE